MGEVPGAPGARACFPAPLPKMNPPTLARWVAAMRLFRLSTFFCPGCIAASSAGGGQPLPWPAHRTQGEQKKPCIIPQMGTIVGLSREHHCWTGGFETPVQRLPPPTDLEPPPPGRLFCRDRSEAKKNRLHYSPNGEYIAPIPRVQPRTGGCEGPVHSDLLFSKLKPPLGAAFLSAADRPVAGVRGQQHGSRRRDAKGRSGSGAAPRLYGTGGSPGAGGRHRSANADVPCQRSHLRRTVPADVAAERARHFRLQFAPATTAPRRSPRGGASDVTG
jgi:hypothetical protein